MTSPPPASLWLKQQGTAAGLAGEVVRRSRTGMAAMLDRHTTPQSIVKAITKCRDTAIVLAQLGLMPGVSELTDLTLKPQRSTH